MTDQYIGFYNGGSGAEYDLGVTRSLDPLSFGAGQIVNPRSEQQSPTILADKTIKAAPSPVRVGNEIFVYYDGYSNAISPMRGNIMMEVYNLDGSPRYRSVTPVLPYTAVSGAASVARPSVTYDPSDAVAPFKMVFCMTKTAGSLNEEVWLAVSPDGCRWTVIGQAFTKGSVWESVSVITTGRMVLKNGKYHIFYGGYDGTRWRGGVATKTEFSSGGWTKNPKNPILLPRGGYDVTPTYDVLAGATWFRVADNSDFDIGSPVMVWTVGNPASAEMNIVVSKPDSINVGVAHPWLGTYTIAGGTRISQVQSRSVDFSEVWHDPTDSKWKSIITAFGFNPQANRETTAYAETRDLDDGFTIIPDIWPLPLRPRSLVWDRYSAENLKVIGPV